MATATPSYTICYHTRRDWKKGRGRLRNRCVWGFRGSAYFSVAPAFAFFVRWRLPLHLQRPLSSDVGVGHRISDSSIDNSGVG